MSGVRRSLEDRGRPVRLLPGAAGHDQLPVVFRPVIRRIGLLPPLRCRTEPRGADGGAAGAMPGVPRLDALDHRGRSRPFERLCASRESQAAVLHGSAARHPVTTAPQPTRYRPCLRCGTMMNRMNFGRRSGPGCRRPPGERPAASGWTSSARVAFRSSTSPREQPAPSRTALEFRVGRKAVWCPRSRRRCISTCARCGCAVGQSCNGRSVPGPTAAGNAGCRRCPSTRAPCLCGNRHGARRGLSSWLVGCRGKAHLAGRRTLSRQRGSERDHAEYLGAGDLASRRARPAGLRGGGRKRTRIAPPLVAGGPPTAVDVYFGGYGTPSCSR